MGFIQCGLCNAKDIYTHIAKKYILVYPSYKNIYLIINLNSLVLALV